DPPKKNRPAIDANFPDPTVFRAPDGYYYVYATNTEIAGELLHIQVAKSEDLVGWEIVGDALPDPPAWADRDVWAPHVLYDRSEEHTSELQSREDLVCCLLLEKNIHD